MSCNQLNLSGLITKVYPVRQTPSGVNVARFVLEHFSSQQEANATCNVKCKMFCIWVDPGDQLIQEGIDVEVSGFISQNAKLQLVLHITEFLNKGK
jgi:primosomal replication protein N